MLALKHKQIVGRSLVLIISVILASIVLLPGNVSAAPITCPDGYETVGPLSERNVICADHQTGGTLRDSGPVTPGCYTEFFGDLSTSSNCGSLTNPDPTKCYKALVTDSGIGQYNEFNCARSSAPSGLPDPDAGTVTNLVGDCDSPNPSKEDCGIIAYLVTIINVLSGLVGIVVVIMITVGGVQYSTARDNPQAVAAAKGRIINAVMALVFYLFMYAFLQYIVPGGVL